MTDWFEKVIVLLESIIVQHPPSPANEEECSQCYAEYYPCKTYKEASKALTIMVEIRDVWRAGTSGEKHV